MTKNKNFLESGIKGLLSASISHNNPLYVQYYITARCNLRCKQCNVIYANADVGEISTSQALKVIDNLGCIYSVSDLINIVAALVMFLRLNFV
jgi:MoaA/NifB/PqqE/SkfB family radical SAM enzyme